MDCQIVGTARCCSHMFRRQEFGDISFTSSNVPCGKLLMGTTRLAFSRASTNAPGGYIFSRTKYPKCQLYWRKRPWRMSVSAVSLDAETSLEGDHLSTKSEPTLDETSENSGSQLLGPDEIKALLIDTERKRLVRKLSEANQHNRFLKRQLQSKDDDLLDLKTDLAMLELELQALVGLAEEVANSGTISGTRKINGKYIQSHLLSRLDAARDKLKQHIKGVDSIKFQEITLSWVGMAESVQVMGSFDGWSEGEDMSPEYDGAYTRFSTTLKLRSGRYEVKFKVDGEWQLSPELPIVGEGLVKNNLLVVE